MQVCSRGLTLAVALLTARPVSAQQIVGAGARSADGLWQVATDQNLPAGQRRADLTGPYAVVQLNRTALDALLALAPNENDLARAAQPVVVTLPLPDGRFSRFRIEESPILAPELAAAFPDIKTYRGSSLDDPTATARLDITQAGFHAIVLAAGGTVYVDPYAPGDLVNHVSYDKASLQRPDTPFRDFVEGDMRAASPLQRAADPERHDAENLPAGAGGDRRVCGSGWRDTGGCARAHDDLDESRERYLRTRAGGSPDADDRNGRQSAGAHLDRPGRLHQQRRVDDAEPEPGQGRLRSSAPPTTISVTCSAPAAAGLPFSIRSAARPRRREV